MLKGVCITITCMLNLCVKTTRRCRDSEVLVRAQGARPENVLFLVHEVFEALISESFHGVQYDFHVPCPGCATVVSREASAMF